MMLRFLDKHRKPSYAQSGEDRIISFLFDWIQINHQPTWMLVHTMLSG